MLSVNKLWWLTLGLWLVGCSPQQPINVGFVGGLSDRNADNGKSGLNGVTLAVEEFNRAGGVNGRLVKLLPQDDAQDPEAAAAAARTLVASGVEAVIGPFTSSMAKVIVPITSTAGIFQISPTLTSMDFYGKDDNLFRINRTTRDNARDYAEFMAARHYRQIAVAYDTRNINFSGSWLAEFRVATARTGSQIVAAVPYSSERDADFERVIRQMIAANPDSLLFIAGALDVARLAQQARKLAPRLPMGAAEWAATEQLVDLGGDTVEGLFIAQSFNRDDDSPRFKNFVEAYTTRFQRPPGYSSVAAYDAALVVLTALRQRMPGEPLKAAALRSGPYPGLQQTIRFDENGDTERKIFFAEVRGRRYVQLAGSAHAR